jgi:arsenite/tail-anchored protein-transporting ATPase
MPRSKATSTPDRARQPPKFTFVGGKGGVGKTTCAAAMGVMAARRGARTLVVSTDPAPSLADALGQRLAATVRPVRAVARLHAVELDAAAAFQRWVASRRDLLETIALRGTWLDRDDVSRLLTLSLPGIDEIAALLEIADFGHDTDYDLIVVDTAPTGHLLRMLSMPAVLRSVARVFDHMQAKHRVMVDALRGAWVPDASDRLIDDIDTQAKAIQALLRNRDRARLAWVTLPESMAIAETLDGLGALRDYGVTVDRVIVNRVTAPPPQPCRWCAARRYQEGRVIASIGKHPSTRDMAVVTVPAVEPEPRGVRSLAAVGRLMAASREFRAPKGTKPQTLTATAPLQQQRGLLASSLVPARTQLLMFGGKGGVGKTTCAAAAAIDVARARPRQQVLLLSTDPAHSTSDVLGQGFSDRPTSIRGGPANLAVRELDAPRVFNELRARFANAIEALFARFAGGGVLQESATAHDRQVMRDLMDLAPPGVDELIAIIEVTETLLAGAGAAPDVVVMDTAPTGHALRLIEMPSLVHDWVKALMAILLKYQPIAGVGDLGAVLVRLSQGLGRLRDIMGDADRTRFVAVTRPAALPRAETIRLIERLQAASVAVPIVIVNAIGGGTCSRCRADRAAQRKEIAALWKQATKGNTSRELVVAPAELPPPHGWRALQRWRSTWSAL